MNKKSSTSFKCKYRRVQLLWMIELNFIESKFILQWSVLKGLEYYFYELKKFYNWWMMNWKPWFVNLETWNQAKQTTKQTL